MTIQTSFLGIDIAKRHLDLFDEACGRSWRIANEVAALDPLVSQQAGRDLLVVFEATGDYDLELRRALERAGIAYSAVNPGRARAFAKAAGFLAKTDAVDARMLALMGRVLDHQPPTQPLEESRRRLVRLHRRRDQLVAMRQQERARLSEAQDEEMRASLEAHIAWLSAAIAEQDKLVAELIAATPDIKAEVRLLRSVPGIGPVAAATLIGLMPELGKRSSKTIAALAGLAPLNRDSGQHRGQRRIAEGRARVRRALYMAALHAARSATRLGAFYKALRHAGKAPKLALIAVARKILITLNAILRDAQPFHP